MAIFEFLFFSKPQYICFEKTKTWSISSLGLFHQTNSGVGSGLVPLLNQFFHFPLTKKMVLGSKTGAGSGTSQSRARNENQCRGLCLHSNTKQTNEKLKEMMFS